MFQTKSFSQSSFSIQSWKPDGTASLSSAQHGEGYQRDIVNTLRAVLSGSKREESEITSRVIQPATVRDFIESQERITNLKTARQKNMSAGRNQQKNTTRH